MRRFSVGELYLHQRQRLEEGGRHGSISLTASLLKSYVYRVTGKIAWTGQSRKWTTIRCLQGQRSNCRPFRCSTGRDRQGDGFHRASRQPIPHAQYYHPDELSCIVWKERKNERTNERISANSLHSKSMEALIYGVPNLAATGTSLYVQSSDNPSRQSSFEPQ